MLDSESEERMAQFIRDPRGIELWRAFGGRVRAAEQRQGLSTIVSSCYCLCAEYAKWLLQPIVPWVVFEAEISRHFIKVLVKLRRSNVWRVLASI